MTDWWVPRDVDELERAVADGAVVETHHHEYKRFGVRESGRPRLPSSLAKSLAGLAVDGGVLVLGVAEDKPSSRFESAPQPLAGLQEGVDRVALTALSPGLRVTVRELRRDDGTGYLVVLVPASPRAPHMVGGRYYGRGDTTTRQLHDIEVRALWARHLDRRERIADLLTRELEREPVAEADRTNARLFVVAQPISADPRLLLDAVQDRDLLRWVRELEATGLYRRGRKYAPTFASAGQAQRRAHGVARSSYYLDSDRTIRIENDRHPAHSRVLDLEYREDGGLRLYYGRASDTHPEHQVRWLMLEAIVGEVAGVIEAARVVSRQAAFHGAWAFGVALRGIRGIAAYDGNNWFHDGWKFSEDDYDEAVEVDRDTLFASGSPVLEPLVGRLVRATTGSSERLAAMDPFPVEQVTVGSVSP